MGEEIIENADNESISEKDIVRFSRLYNQLLFFVNQRAGLFADINTVDDLRKKGYEEKVKIRNAILKKPGLITSFVSENPNLVPKDELEIVEGWKKGLFGEFYLVKYDKDYTVFYDPKGKKCYGVILINDPLKPVIGSYLPIIVRTWLIPYMGKIIYDGLLESYNLSFGTSIKSSIRAESEESAIRGGIITAFDDEQQKSETDSLSASAEEKDGELLRFYLKSGYNREMYWEEIDDLRKKSPKLSIIYSKELGKINSRHLKKRLKHKNLKGYFAILEDVIIASCISKKGLLENLDKILENDEKKESVHIIKL